MKLGVVFPQTEIGADPGAVREYALAVQDLGYDHLLVYDHVLGADPSYYQGWSGVYTHEAMFHEPMVLFGYLAGIVPQLELITGIVILPQRQTALVAKQAAEVDILTGGRLRLGIGIGWNAVEYEALGQDFHTRGRRVEEQINLLRDLWTREVVTFEGRWDTVTASGINPLPVQRPIPIWMGGHADAVLRRVGRLSDGWIPTLPPDHETGELWERIKDHARQAGRDAAAIGLEGSVRARQGTLDDWVATTKAWGGMGASHVSMNTMGAGLTSVKQHVDVLRRFHEVMSG
jgi:probable F420-dependent oxidoreductase